MNKFINFININRKKIVFAFILVFLVLIIIIYTKENSKYDSFFSEDTFLNQNSIYSNNNNNDDNIMNIDSTNNSYLNFQEKSLGKIKVHVTGEITSPGLYDLDEGARINDLILLAGGQTQNADLNRINLAYELSDGEKIYIPSIFDEVSTYIYNDAGENVSEIPNNNINSGKININKATLEELEQISGIGPSLAQKIISYRNTNGKFNSIDELKNVSGIGDKKFEAIKDYISLK